MFLIELLLLGKGGVVGGLRGSLLVVGVAQSGGSGFQILPRIIQGFLGGCPFGVLRQRCVKGGLQLGDLRSGL